MMKYGWLVFGWYGQYAPLLCWVGGEWFEGINQEIRPLERFNIAIQFRALRYFVE